MASGQTQSLLIKRDRWEIRQHLDWISGSYSFLVLPGSPVDPFNLEVRWLFRPNTGALIGAIRLLEEGGNTRIIFVTYPFPSSEGPGKFLEFFQRIRDYFVDSIIVEGDNDLETLVQETSASGEQRREKQTRKRGVNNDTPVKIAKLRAYRLQELERTGKIPVREVSCGLIEPTITAKTVRKHAPELWANWYVKEYR